MNLSIVRVRQRLGKNVPVILVFRDIVPEAGKDGFVKSLGWVLCLRVVRCGRLVLNSK